MKACLLVSVYLFSTFFIYAQVSQKEFDRYLQTLYSSNEAKAVKAFFDGNTVDSLYLFGLIEIGGKKFYTMNHEKLYHSFVDATISKLPKSNWTKGKSLVKALQLDLQDTLEIQDLEKDVWAIYRAGLYPTPNAPNYMAAVKSILKQNNIESSGLAVASNTKIENTISQLNGYSQFKAYLYWFYHLIAINKKDVVNRYLPKFIKRAVDNVSMTPDQFCFIYLTSGKLVNTLNYEKNFTYAIQLFSTARLYHAQGNGTLDERITIAGIIAESISNLPGWEAKKQAFESIYRFYSQNRHILNIDQEMKCYVLLAKYGIEMRESKEFETGVKDRDMTVPLYNYKCYEYFSKVGGPYFLMTNVNIIKQMRVDRKYRDMAHFALHAFESSFGLQEAHNSRIISFITKAFRLSDYYLNDRYSHSPKQFAYDVNQLKKEGKISKEKAEEMIRGVNNIDAFEGGLRDMGISGDFLYFFWKINEMEFYLDRDIEQGKVLDLNNFANSKLPFSAYYFRNIFKFLPESKLQGEGFETPKKTIMSLHRLFYRFPDEVGEVQYHLGYELSQSEGTLAVHKKKLEVYDLNENNQKLEDLSVVLSDSIILQQDEIGTLNVQSRQKDSTIALKENELANLNTEISQLKIEKTRIEIAKKKAEEELIFAQDTVLFQQGAITIISLLLVIAGILFVRARTQKKRAIESEKRATASERKERIQAFTISQLGHTAPDCIKVVMEELQEESKEYVILDKLQNLLDQFHRVYNSERIMLNKEVDLINMYLDLKYPFSANGRLASHRIEYKIDQPDHIPVPTFALMNVMSNAYNYGDILEEKVLVLITGNVEYVQVKVINKRESEKKSDQRPLEEEDFSTGLKFIEEILRAWNGSSDKMIDISKSTDDHFVVEYQFLKKETNV